jgi:hypothetical protein
LQHPVPPAWNGGFVEITQLAGAIRLIDRNLFNNAALSNLDGFLGLSVGGKWAVQFALIEWGGLFLGRILVSQDQ